MKRNGLWLVVMLVLLVFLPQCHSGGGGGGEEEKGEAFVPPGQTPVPSEGENTLVEQGPKCAYALPESATVVAIRWASVRELPIVKKIIDSALKTANTKKLTAKKAEVTEVVDKFDSLKDKLKGRFGIGGGVAAEIQDTIKKPANPLAPENLASRMEIQKTLPEERYAILISAILSEFEAKFGKSYVDAIINSESICIAMDKQNDITYIFETASPEGFAPTELPNAYSSYVGDLLIFSKGASIADYINLHNQAEKKVQENSTAYPYPAAWSQVPAASVKIVKNLSKDSTKIFASPLQNSFLAAAIDVDADAKQIKIASKWIAGDANLNPVFESMSMLDYGLLAENVLSLVGEKIGNIGVAPPTGGMPMPNPATIPQGLTIPDLVKEKLR